MFDALGDKLNGVFKKLRGEARLTEENMAAAVREVRLALLEADVNFKVVRDFTAAVREKALGAEVLGSLRPAQQFVGIVHQELVALLGGEVAPFELSKGRVNVILLLGLQGSGKTTLAGKLALRMKKEGLSPLLVACDIHRPAAVDQLKVVGAGVGVPVFEMGTSKPAPEIAERGLAEAKRNGNNLVIVDTAGRLHIDEVKMDELQEIKARVKPHYAFFVADAMTGQDAVVSAERFAEGIGIDGVCLTKMDGDARGGAALSVKSVTGKPIYFVGVGEKSDELEPFYPDRMASRILGMGDVLTLVEKAQEQVDQKEAEEMQKKLKKGNFSLQDFLDQTQRVKKMGSLKSLLGMIPGLGQALKGIEIDDDMMKPMEAIIHSMTPAERENPDVIDGSRRKRIAKGSGRDPAEINSLIKEFNGMRAMMSQMMGGGMGGMMRQMMGGGAAPAQMPRGGAFGQKTGRSEADTAGQKLKPKHRRKQDSKKNKKKKR
ncbi:signal recognition particle protein [bacterium]|nr:signal recognition particle protein [bacterium]